MRHPFYKTDSRRFQKVLRFMRLRNLSLENRDTPGLRVLPGDTYGYYLNYT
jgi:hypothetical protein